MEWFTTKTKITPLIPDPHFLIPEKHKKTQSKFRLRFLYV